MLKATKSTHKLLIAHDVLKTDKQNEHCVRLHEVINYFMQNAKDIYLYILLITLSDVSRLVVFV